MPKTEPFARHAERYEEWFAVHEHAYRSELDALGRLVGDPGSGVEIGVGSARFAAPLDIAVGLDPTPEMLVRARERGVEVVRGVAEALPFADGSFDTALIVTTICFVDDVPATLTEANRVLGSDGKLVIGYVDRDSQVGRMYQEHKAENPFYRDAVFVSTEELLSALEDAGFTDLQFVQTIFSWPGDLEGPDEIREGYGEGSFVGVAARA
jgi:SAM-dependent methyltransferase